MTIIAALYSDQYKAIAADILLTTRPTDESKTQIASVALPLQSPNLRSQFQIYGKTEIGVALSRKIVRINHYLVLAWAGPVDLACTIVRGFRNNVEHSSISQPEALDLLKYLWTHMPSGRAVDLSIIGLCHNDKETGIFSANATKIELPGWGKALSSWIWNAALFCSIQEML